MRSHSFVRLFALVLLLGSTRCVCSFDSDDESESTDNTKEEGQTSGSALHPVIILTEVFRRLRSEVRGATTVS